MIPHFPDVVDATGAINPLALCRALRWTLSTVLATDQANRPGSVDQAGEVLRYWRAYPHYGPLGDPPPFWWTGAQHDLLLLLRSLPEMS